MAFNKENLARVRREYETKHLEAEKAADEKRAFLQQRIPGLAELDARIARTGPRLMAIALHKSSETTEQIRADVTAMRARRALMLRQAGFPEDYSDVRYSCSLCSDSGYVGDRMCSCMRRALTEAGYRSAGIDCLMEKCTFASFSLDYYRDDPISYRSMVHNYETLRRYAAEFSLKSRNLLLIGGTGLGKTHLSVALTRSVTENGFDALYTGAVGMFADFESAHFGKSDGTENGYGTERYFTAELLVIDDLGTEMTSQYNVSCLYDLINRRLARSLPTVINTNLDLAALEAKYTTRIVSRLYGDYQPLQFLGNDIRLQKLRTPNG